LSSASREQPFFPPLTEPIPPPLTGKPQHIIL